MSDNRSRCRMEGESCRHYLLLVKQWSVEEQQKQEGDIVQAFKEFWDSWPTEEDFAAHVGKIVLFSKMLFYMTAQWQRTRNIYY
mgnify:CR=1 FL=1